MTTPPIEVEIREISMPLVRPFRTSRGVETAKETLLVRWSTPEATGWAEAGVEHEPVYYAETTATTTQMLTDVLVPTARDIAASGAPLLPTLRTAFADLPGLPLSKAVLETAILDHELRRTGMSMADHLGGHREQVPVGVSVGIPDSVDELLDWVRGYVADGYGRVKLKVRPGWDLEPLRAVRGELGPDFPLQVDANQAYRPGDSPHLRRFDEFGLLLLEQPFPGEDLLAHARLAADLATPVCLDESITSLATAATAITLRAADSINIKPARVGGYLTARAVHDLCLAHGIPVFCGGMLETGIGRAMNLHLAGLPGFTLPGDISATSRYFERDITQSFELVDGHLTAPLGPGSGAVVDLDAVDDFTVSVRTL